MDVDHATDFFRAWQLANAASLPKSAFDEWLSFFNSWNQLDEVNVVVPERVELDCEKLKAFAITFAEKYEVHWRSGGMVNIWRTAGIGNDELRNCEVLKWILDKNGDHGQGSAILERLVDLAGGSVTAKLVRENKYWTHVESLPLGDLQSRVDIEIESPAFLIFIEAKLNASESGDQLRRYSEIARLKSAGRPWTVVFLTIDGRKPQDIDQHELIVLLSWRQIAGAVDAYVNSHSLNGLPIQVFRQFADHIRQFA